MRISYWSSAWCSSDLFDRGQSTCRVALSECPGEGVPDGLPLLTGKFGRVGDGLGGVSAGQCADGGSDGKAALAALRETFRKLQRGQGENGRASYRERVCQYV